MNKLFLKPANKLITINSNLYTCNVENQRLFRMLSIDVLNNIVFSINDVPISDKSIYLLYNPFKIDINDPKLIKFLFKNLEKEIRQSEITIINDIEIKTIELLEKLSIICEHQLDFNLTFDLPKFFNAIGVCYKIPDSYLEKLVMFIKLIVEITKCTLIISFGLLRLLDENEIVLLKKELYNLNIYIIDINYIEKNIKSDIIIDKEWCVL